MNDTRIRPCGIFHTWAVPSRLESKLVTRMSILHCIHTTKEWRWIPLLLLLLPARLAAADAYCPAYQDSDLYRPRSRQVAANQSNWISAIESARVGDEILLENGIYPLDRYSIAITKAITIRSASGDRDAVLIQGEGYGTPSEGLMIMAGGVTIADLSMTGMRNHAISMKGELGARTTHIYNVHLFDVGTQHIKGTPSTSDGVVACSRIGYTPSGVQGDYINGIDIHGATDWVIRDNELYNIWGDGSGCEVDEDCGTYEPGGGPSILLWNNSSGSRVERNRIVDSFRGIALGFYTTHSGGVVRNNFIYQSSSQQNGVSGDAGISVWGSQVEIDHNTVILGTSYPGAIEIQDSSDLQIRNNLITEPVWNRGNSTYHAQGNKTDATKADLASPGKPHLSPDSQAVDYPSAVILPNIDHDIEGNSRPLGLGPDAGCDEVEVDSVLLFGDSFESGDTSAWTFAES